MKKKCLLTPTVQAKEWIVEFRKKFQKHKLFAKGAFGFELDDMIDFISSTLAEARREERTALCEQIKKMKIYDPTTTWGEIGNVGYNQALSDILSVLKKEGEI
jgi:hypothetical protein